LFSLLDPEEQDTILDTLGRYFSSSTNFALEKETYKMLLSLNFGIDKLKKHHINWGRNNAQTLVSQIGTLHPFPVKEKLWDEKKQYLTFRVMEFMYEHSNASSQIGWRRFFFSLFIIFHFIRRFITK
jgi:hypothetical protein